MEKYIKVYSFELLDKIAEGKTVYFLDRQVPDIGCVNGQSATRFCQIVKDKDEVGRYDFWCIEGGER